MRRDVLLLEQMIEAADQAVGLVEGMSVADLAADRIRRDALLWNFTVLGEASAQLSVQLRQEFADVNRLVCGTESCTGIGPSTLTLSMPPLKTSCLHSPRKSSGCSRPSPGTIEKRR